MDDVRRIYILLTKMTGSARVNNSVLSLQYDRDWFGLDIHGATLGIVGMGNIGYQVARRSIGFDMKILYHNRNRRQDKEHELGK